MLFMAIIIVASQCGTDIEEKVCEFNKKSEINNLLYYATAGWAFRIPNEDDRKLWNSLIDEEWSGLDDDDYLRYDKPFVRDNKWSSEIDGHFLSVQEVINEHKNKIKMLTKVKNLYGGQF